MSGGSKPVIYRRRAAPRALTVLKAIRIHSREPAEHDESPRVVEGQVRPRTRGDCVEGERPCPWMGCRHHLALDVDPETGAIKLNFPHLELEDMVDTCSLDVSDRGENKIDAVGDLLNITRSRAGQILDRVVGDPAVRAQLVKLTER